MIDKELLSYLELVPKDPISKINETIPEINLKKTNKKLVKFLTRIPFSVIYSSEYLSKLTNSLESTKDKNFKKINYIGYDYEKYVNTDEFVELNERYPKRKLPLENKLSKRFRRIQTTTTECKIMAEKISFEQILKNFKVSLKTQELKMKNGINLIKMLIRYLKKLTITFEEK